MIDYQYGVTLEPLLSEYSDTLIDWRNDYRIRKWTRQFDLISDLDQKRWFEKQASDPTIRMYAIEKELHLMGVCGFTSLDLINRRAEFSLYIAPENQGQSLGKSALKTLVTHGFNAFGFNLIWGEVFEGNPAKGLFSALGFKLDGIRRQFYFRDGKFIDAHLMSLLRQDWIHHDQYTLCKEPRCST